MGHTEEEGATDLSRYEIFDTNETVQTLAELQEMKDAYTALLAADNCAEALPKIIDFYKAANLTSNLMRRGNEPFYSADRDGRDQVARDRKLLNTMIEAESTFNNLLRQRNEAWVRKPSVCYQKANARKPLLGFIAP